ncbi:uncharacterized protein B0H18DRAFT_1114443 [Fomitopsis serialis]|uniref:uncharacterized protein n=1 Tax=Fomitopsis serialis TaxID=139415 RepID=UPI0020087337|nr:uncharacterized protein B0H18DRAFT_1114443 [Neoantrodia serialis]KAH9935735.1 hypothetical protein B0H18DRAFT_1114443 [Neoantrodia serialis]
MALFEAYAAARDATRQLYLYIIEIGRRQFGKVIRRTQHLTISAFEVVQYGWNTREPKLSLPQHASADDVAPRPAIAATAPPLSAGIHANLTHSEDDEALPQHTCVSDVQPPWSAIATAVPLPLLPVPLPLLPGPPPLLPTVTNITSSAHNAALPPPISPATLSGVSEDTARPSQPLTGTTLEPPRHTQAQCPAASDSPGSGGHPGTPTLVILLGAVFLAVCAIHVVAQKCGRGRRPHTKQRNLPRSQHPSQDLDVAQARPMRRSNPRLWAPINALQDIYDGLHDCTSETPCFAPGDPTVTYDFGTGRFPLRLGIRVAPKRSTPIVVDPSVPPLLDDVIQDAMDLQAEMDAAWDEVLRRDRAAC